MRSLLLWKFLILPWVLFSQLTSPPVSHLFSCQLEPFQDNFFVKDVKYLSGFNTLGYNNQPYFVGENQIMICSAKPSEATDIYLLYLNQQLIKPLTDTPEPEYSPKPIPHKSAFSVVRVSQDTVQELWEYPLEPGLKGKLIIKNSTKIGYYTWVNDTLAVIYHVGTPSVLKAANLKTERTITFASDVGRCLMTGANKQVYYVHKLTNQLSYLKSYDLFEKKSILITESLPGVDDFTLVNDQLIIMAKGSALYYFRAGTNQTSWNLIQDLAPYGLKNITRLAYQNGTLVLVDQPN